MLSEPAAAARRKYKRAWAAANPDKIRRYQETYWQRYAERMAQQEAEAQQEQTARQAEGAQDDL